MHLAFRVDGLVLALPIGAVIRALPMIDVLPLPETQPFVLGAIDLGGRALPLIDMKRYLGRGDTAIAPDLTIVVVDLGARRVGLVVEAVLGVRAIDPGSAVAAPEIAPGARRLGGVGRIGADLMLIYDPRTFLTGDEQAAIAAALAEVAP
jgi:purine-binding chemotaxis protein CheW